MGVVWLSVNGPRNSGSQHRVGGAGVRRLQVVCKPLPENHVCEKSTDGGEGAYEFRPNHRCLVLNLQTRLNATVDDRENTHTTDVNGDKIGIVK